MPPAMGDRQLWESDVMATIEVPDAGQQVIVHPLVGEGARRGTTTRMPDASLWVTFERGANEPWDGTRMHPPTETCRRCNHV